MDLRKMARELVMDAVADGEVPPEAIEGMVESYVRWLADLEARNPH